MIQGTEGTKTTEEIPHSYNIPTEADFLIAYSTVEGKKFSF